MKTMRLWGEVVTGLLVDGDDEDDAAGETGVVTGWVTAAVTAAWLGEVVLCLTGFGLWWCVLARSQCSGAGGDRAMRRCAYEHRRGHSRCA